MQLLVGIINMEDLLVYPTTESTVLPMYMSMPVAVGIPMALHPKLLPISVFGESPVEIQVFPSPADYMLTPFDFPSLNWDIFYRFFYNNR